MTAAAPLATLLAPQRVAVVGSVSRPDRMGARTVQHLEAAGFPGEVVAVSDVADLDGSVDVAVVAVPAAGVAGVLHHLAGRAAHAIVYTSGFGEAGAPALVAPPGMGLLGPNTVGLYWAPSRAVLTFAKAFDDLTDCQTGPGVTLISQSGAFGARLVRAARHRGLVIDGFVATGNEDGYRATDVLAALATLDDRPRVVGIYLEGLSDGGELASSVAAARAAGIEVVVLFGGRSLAASAAAASHTAAVSADHVVVDELLRLHDAVVVPSDRAMVDALLACSLQRRAGGRNVAIVTGSGGAGVVAADLLAAAGAQVPPLSPALRAALDELLPGYASSTNPVDVTASVIGDTAKVAEVVGLLAAAPEVDVVLAVGRGDQAAALEAAGEAHGTPVVTALLDGEVDEVRALTTAGHLALGDLEAGARAAATLTRDALELAARLDPEAPPAATAAVAGTADVVSSLEQMQAAGIELAPWVLARDLDEVEQAFDKLGGPVVLKANVDAATHKAAAGGVRLDLFDRAALLEAAHALLSPGGSVVVAKQLRGGPELFVGVRADAAAGLVVSMGLGGGAMEMVRRTVALPADASEAWRSQRLLDRVFNGDEAWAGTADALSRFATNLIGLARRSGAALVECNPIVETAEGLVALDARVL